MKLDFKQETNFGLMGESLALENILEQFVVYYLVQRIFDVQPGPGMKPPAIRLLDDPL